jgi:vancomycin resistance protein YoaR
VFKKNLKSIKIFPRTKKDKKNLFSLIGVLILLLVFFVFFNLYYAYQNRFYPRIFVDGINLGSLTKNEAQQLLNKKVGSLENEEIIFKREEKNIKTSLPKLGIKINQERTISSAYNIGRSTNALSNFWILTKSFFQDFESPFYFEIEENKLNNFITQNLESLERIPQDAQIIYKNNNFEVTPSKEGWGVDHSSVIIQIIEAISDSKKNTIEPLAEIEKRPKIIQERALEIRDKANDLLEKTTNFNAGNKYWSADRNTIANFLIFKEAPCTGFENNVVFSEDNEKENIISCAYHSKGVEFENIKENYCLGIAFNREKIKDYLEILAPGIEQEGVNANLGFQDGKMIIVNESQDQISLDIEKSIFLLAEGILNGNDPVELAVNREKALISQDNLEELGIETLIGQGNSDFSGSPKNRRHNIAVGASKFNGVLVKPNEIFSFLEILGPVNASTGYLPELVIKLDKTIPEYGGGMCQVSTTAFRGAVNSGFEIIERVNHAYPVQYYSPQGTDATVYIPSPDLKFLNNTPAHVLIQTKITGNILTFEFYGTNDERKVKTSGPTIYDRKPDGSMRAKWIQKVYRADGNLLFEKEFLSKYDSPSKYPHPGEEDEEEDKKKKKKKD